MKLQMVITGLGALAIGAAALAPQAHADENTFLNDLSSRGIPTNTAVLAVGHEICSDVSAYGTQGFDMTAEAAHEANVPSYDFAVITVSAVYDLCPSNMPALHAWLHNDE